MSLLRCACDAADFVKEGVQPISGLADIHVGYCKCVIADLLSNIMNIA